MCISACVGTQKPPQHGKRQEFWLRLGNCVGSVPQRGPTGSSALATATWAGVEAGVQVEFLVVMAAGTQTIFWTQYSSGSQDAKLSQEAPGLRTGHRSSQAVRPPQETQSTRPAQEPQALQATATQDQLPQDAQGGQDRTQSAAESRLVGTTGQLSMGSPESQVFVRVLSGGVLFGALHHDD